jgi:hypothetical protein
VSEIHPQSTTRYKSACATFGTGIDDDNREIVMSTFREITKSAFVEIYHKWEHFLPSIEEILKLVDDNVKVGYGVRDVVRKLSQLSGNSEEKKESLRHIGLGIEQAFVGVNNYLFPRRQWEKLFESQPLLAQLVTWEFKVDEPNIFHGRRLTTIGGSTPALVPEQAREGDLVVVLTHYSMPVALRPLGVDQPDLEAKVREEFELLTKMSLEGREMHNFQIIGGCFVEGLMFGNANQVIESLRETRMRILLHH